MPDGKDPPKTGNDIVDGSVANRNRTTGTGAATGQPGDLSMKDIENAAGVGSTSPPKAATTTPPTESSGGASKFVKEMVVASIVAPVIGPAVVGAYEVAKAVTKPATAKPPKM